MALSQLSKLRAKLSGDKDGKKGKRPSTPKGTESERSNEAISTGTAAQDPHSDNLAEGIRVPGNGTPRPTESPAARSRVLWNRAYDALKMDEDNKKLIAAYEKVLSRVFLKDSVARQTATDAKGDETKGDENAIAKDQSTREEQMKEIVVAGLQRIDKARKATDVYGLGLDFLIQFKAVLDAGLQSVPQAALPWAIVSASLDILAKPAKASRANSSGIKLVNSKMDWYNSLADQLLMDNNIVGANLAKIRLELEKDILNLYKALILYQVKSVCSYYRHHGLVFLRGFIALDDWTGDLQAVTDAEDILRKNSEQYHTQELRELVKRQLISLKDIADIQKELDQEKEDRQVLQDLRAGVDPRDEISNIRDRKDRLVEDSYKWILGTDEFKAFMDWSVDAPRLLWIKGQAGMGKTMLLMGIIHELNEQRTSTPDSADLAYFFCQGSIDELSTAVATLRSLIWLLLLQQPYLISYVREKYESAGKNVFTDRNAFYALSGMLKSMIVDENLSRVVLIIDALDECDAQTKPGLMELLQLVKSTTSSSPNVKWLVSGRPEPLIESKLKSERGEEGLISTINLDSQDLEQPISAYIDYKVQNLKEKDGYSVGLLGQIADNLRRSAGKTFLWVWLICEELEKAEFYSALDVLKAFPTRLAGTYDYLLARIEQQNWKDPQYCKMVLRATAIAYRPLATCELEIMSGLPEGIPVAMIVKKCGSFLVVREDTVYPIHQSAQEYLLTHLGDVSHLRMTERALKGLKRLRRNMYQLTDPGADREEIDIPDPDPLLPLRYPCLFWIDHLCESLDNFSEDMVHAVWDFFKTGLLYWIEALCFLSELSNGILAIIKLNEMIQNAKIHDEFRSIVQDTYRFLLFHRGTIEYTPLQVYISALIFSPKNSIVRRTYSHEHPRWIKTFPEMDDMWDACLQSHDHPDFVHSIAYLSDGRIASASEGEIHIFHGKTGELQRTITAIPVPNEKPLYLAALPDERLVSGGDNGLTVWSKTGDVEKTLLPTAIDAVATSEDGRVAFATENGTLQIWKEQNGEYLTLAGHTDLITALAFAQDGRLASGSEDRTVRIWSRAGEMVHSAPQDSSVSSLAFSSAENGTRLAVGMRAGQLRYYTGDLSDYKLLRGTRDQNYSRIDALQFLRRGDEDLLVSGNGVGILRLWDCSNLRLLYSFRAHSHRVLSLAVSPDGTLASSSIDSTLKVWDKDLFRGHTAVAGHTDNVGVVALSRDMKTIASACWDNMIFLWDINGLLKSKLVGDRPHVRSLDFSPDDKYLAWGCDNGTVGLWDLAAKAMVPSPVTNLTINPYSQVGTTRFSPDGRFLVTIGEVEHDRTKGELNLWSVKPNELRLERQLVGEFGLELAFHGQNMAYYVNPPSPTTEGGMIIYTCDTDTFEVRNTIHSSDMINRIAFSPDGELLVAATTSTKVLIYSLTTKQLVRSYELSRRTRYDTERILYNIGKIGLELIPDIYALAKGSQNEYTYKHSSIADWVMWNKYKVMYLPDQYVQSYLGESIQERLLEGDKVLVIGCESGRVLVFRFSSEVSPKEPC